MSSKRAAGRRGGAPCVDLVSVSSHPLPYVGRSCRLDCCRLGVFPGTTYSRWHLFCLVSCFCPGERRLEVDKFTGQRLHVVGRISTPPRGEPMPRQNMTRYCCSVLKIDGTELKMLIVGPLTGIGRAGKFSWCQLREACKICEGPGRIPPVQSTRGHPPSSRCEKECARSFV